MHLQNCSERVNRYGRVARLAFLAKFQKCGLVSVGLPKKMYLAFFASSQVGCLKKFVWPFGSFLALLR